MDLTEQDNIDNAYREGYTFGVEETKANSRSYICCLGLPCPHQGQNDTCLFEGACLSKTQPPWTVTMCRVCAGDCNTCERVEVQAVELPVLSQSDHAIIDTVNDIIKAVGELNRAMARQGVRNGKES